jgi:hypothetical protein
MNLDTPESGAPASNEDGVVLGLSQLNTVDWSTWNVDYDRDTDTMTFAKDGAGAAVAYFIPEEPHILVRLDARTGELLAVDFTGLRRSLAKRYKAFRILDVLWRATQLSQRIPAPVKAHLAALQWLFQASKRDAKEQVRHTTLQFCHSA